MRPLSGPGSWGSYFDGWAATASDWGDWFGDYANATLQTVLTYVANPGGAFTALVLDTATFLIDSGIADGFFGFVDGLLDTLNPFEALWSVPDFGPQFGHTTAYAIGNVAGMVTGVAVGFVIGNAAAPGSGLVACGSLLQKAAKVYTVVDSFAGVAVAGVHALQGKFGLGDVLAAAPAVGFTMQKLKGLPDGCFAAGTAVAVRRLPGVLVADGALPLVEPAPGAETVAALCVEPPVLWERGLVALGVASVPLGLAGYGLARRRRKTGRGDDAEEGCDGLADGEEWSFGEEGLADDATWALLVQADSDRGRVPEADAPWSDREPVQSAVAPNAGLHEETEPNKPIMASRKRGQSRREATPSTRAVWGVWWLAACLALCAVSLWHGLVGSAPVPRSETAAATAATNLHLVGDRVLLSSLPVDPGAPNLLTRPIEEIRVGQRVLGQNPQRPESERAAAVEPDWATWRLLKAWMLKANGKRLDVILLRPATWLEEKLDEDASTIELDLPELGAVGTAHVWEVSPCPAIEPGEGNVVTGTFCHEPSGDLLNVSIEGVAEPIGCTPTHPFWSEDRQQFVPAGQLRLGEKVDTVLGATSIVTVAPRHSTEPVYNLEVHGEHAFRVGSLGALVHNICGSARNALETGGFARGITADEITAINRRLGGATTLTGDVSTVLANAARQEGFWKKAATIVRDIAGRHLFNDANKRTAQAVVEELMRRNGITSGVSPEKMRKVILQVARGELRSIEDIARALRGF